MSGSMRVVKIGDTTTLVIRNGAGAAEVLVIPTGHPDYDLSPAEIVGRRVRLGRDGKGARELVGLVVALPRSKSLQLDYENTNSYLPGDIIDGAVLVLWPAGHVTVCRWGVDECFDLELLPDMDKEKPPHSVQRDFPRQGMNKFDSEVTSRWDIHRE